MTWKEYGLSKTYIATSKKNRQKVKYLDFIYYEGIGKKMLIKLGS